MTPISCHPRLNGSITQSGFVLLRSLLSVIIIIVCFSILTGGIAVYARQETVLLDRIIKEINKNNDGQMKRINL